MNRRTFIGTIIALPFVNLIKVFKGQEPVSLDDELAEFRKFMKESAPLMTKYRVRLPFTHTILSVDKTKNKVEYL